MLPMIAIASMEWVYLLLASLACTALEIVLPGERQSVLSRVKGAAFWIFYIPLSAMTAVVGSWLLADTQPLLRIDVRGADGWAGLAIAYVAMPLVAAFVKDFGYYWFHRAQHAVPVLWRFHAVHHSIREMNGFSSYHHPLEEVFRLFLLVIPLQLLVSISVEQIVAVSIIMRMWGQFIHTNSAISIGPLRYLLCEPRFHRVHHSLDRAHWDRNFSAQFPVLDVIFGTAHFPKPGEYPATGLADKPEPEGIADFLTSPFRSGKPAATK